MEYLGKKVSFNVINRIGDKKGNDGIYLLNEGMFNNIKVIIIDSYKKEKNYRGYIIGVAHITKKKYVYLVSKRRKIYSSDYLNAKIDFMKPLYIDNYIPNNNGLPVIKKIGSEYFYHSGSYLYNNLIYAFENLTMDCFYFSFDTHIISYESCNKFIDRGIAHSHSHDFENVVNELYHNPESFRIKNDEVNYYSDQEIKYLKKLKSYLLALGLKDINVDENQVKRVNNSFIKKRTKYKLSYFTEQEKIDILKNKIAYNYYFYYKRKYLSKEEYCFLYSNNEIFAVAVRKSKIYNENNYPKELLKNDIFIKELNEYKENNSNTYIIYSEYKIVEYIDQSMYFKYVV